MGRCGCSSRGRTANQSGKQETQEDRKVAGEEAGTTGFSQRHSVAEPQPKGLKPPRITPISQMGKEEKEENESELKNS
jgi:hypothetical protein